MDGIHQNAGRSQTGVEIKNKKNEAVVKDIVKLWLSKNPFPITSLLRASGIMFLVVVCWIEFTFVYLFIFFEQHTMERHHWSYWRTVPINMVTGAKKRRKRMQMIPDFECTLVAGVLQFC